MKFFLKKIQTEAHPFLMLAMGRGVLASAAQEGIAGAPEVISIRLCRYDLWKYFQT